VVRPGYDRTGRLAGEETAGEVTPGSAGETAEEVAGVVTGEAGGVVTGDVGGVVTGEAGGVVTGDVGGVVTGEVGAVVTGDVAGGVVAGDDRIPVEAGAVVDGAGDEGAYDAWPNGGRCASMARTR